jgi:hypothetical protein
MIYNYIFDVMTVVYDPQKYHFIDVLDIKSSTKVLEI